MEKEKKGFLGRRGLLEDDITELQNFEIFLPLDFRKFLDTVYHS